MHSLHLHLFVCFQVTVSVQAVLLKVTCVRNVGVDQSAVPGNPPVITVSRYWLIQQRR